MDTLVFNVAADNVGINVSESIKAFFGSQNVRILVKPETSLIETIKKNRNSNISYLFKGDDFDEISDKILNDEVVDFEPYKK